MNVCMNTVNDFGYSYIDWQYAKRKQKEPDLSFEEVLKETLENIKKGEYKNGTCRRIETTGKNV